MRNVNVTEERMVKAGVLCDSSMERGEWRKNSQALLKSFRKVNSMLLWVLLR